MAASSSRRSHPANGPTASAGYAVVVPERVAARRMRTDERGVDEEGLVTVPIEPVEELGADEGGLRELGREASWRPRRAVRIGPREPVHRLVEVVGVRGHVHPTRGEPTAPGRTALLPRVHDQGTEAGKNAFVGVQPRIAGGHRAWVDRRVGIPEEHRVVAEFPCHQRHVRETRVEGRPVQDRAVSVQVRAGVEAGP